MRVEEHDEENNRHSQGDLGPDPEPEPQQEYRRQHDPRQRVQQTYVGIDQRTQPRSPCQAEAAHHTRRGTDGERQSRLF